MKKKVSIIIPTYKRPKELEICIKAILGQQRPLNDTEIIVIDDSEQCEGSKIIEKLKGGECEIIYKKNPKKGRAQARNEGIKHAKGDVIIFIGDDIVVTPKWLQEHIDFHEKHKDINHAVVGHITWYPELQISRYMRWLENGGPLLSFKGLQDGKKTDMYHFYTGNVSLKRKLLEKEGFNEQFDVYGWEDIEFGNRLKERYNLVLWYAKNALAYHNHEYKEDDLEEYAENLGYSAELFQKKIMAISITPHWTKRLIFSIMSRLIPVLRRIKKEWYWYGISKKYFLKGQEKAKRENP